MVLDLSYIRDNSLIDFSGVDDSELSKYESRAVNILSVYIDFSQYDDTMPLELQDSVLYTIEFLYKKSGLFGDEYESEKLGDYSYKKIDDIYRILPEVIMQTIKKFQNRAGFIWVRVGGYDREYVW